MRVSCYLSFIEHARRPVGGFHNFLSYQRDWLDAAGTGDCQGQAVLAWRRCWAAICLAVLRVARELLVGALPALTELRSLRAQAYVIQAWSTLWRAGVEDMQPMATVARHAARRLVERYHRSQRADWPWFESQLTYANAVLPHALFEAAECWPDDRLLAIAETSFDFLDRVTTVEDVFEPVGNRDWYAHGEEKSLFDQQPVEASTMAAAALAGYQMRSDDRYLAVFLRARQWFLGRNSLRQPLANVDAQDGSCCDGLQPTQVNRNQGAESTLAYLWTELLWSSNRALFMESAEKSLATT